MRYIADRLDKVIEAFGKLAAISGERGEVYEKAIKLFDDYFNDEDLGNEIEYYRNNLNDIYFGAINWEKNLKKIKEDYFYSEGTEDTLNKAENRLNEANEALKYYSKKWEESKDFIKAKTVKDYPEASIVVNESVSNSNEIKDELKSIKYNLNVIIQTSKKLIKRVESQKEKHVASKQSIEPKIHVSNMWMGNDILYSYREKIRKLDNTRKELMANIDACGIIQNRISETVIKTLFIDSCNNFIKNQDKRLKEANVEINDSLYIKKTEQLKNLKSISKEMKRIYADDEYVNYKSSKIPDRKEKLNGALCTKIAAIDEFISNISRSYNINKLPQLSDNLELLAREKNFLEKLKQKLSHLDEVGPSFMNIDNKIDEIAAKRIYSEGRIIILMNETRNIINNPSPNNRIR